MIDDFQGFIRDEDNDDSALLDGLKRPSLDRRLTDAAALRNTKDDYW